MKNLTKVVLSALFFLPLLMPLDALACGGGAGGPGGPGGPGGSTAWLGVGIEALPGDEGRGVRVVEVVSGSAAEKAGLAEGDVVRRLNGIDVSGPDTFVSDIAALAVGADVTLQVQRDGKERTLTATLGSKPGAPGRMAGRGGPRMAHDCPHHADKPMGGGGPGGCQGGPGLKAHDCPHHAKGMPGKHMGGRADYPPGSMMRMVDRLDLADEQRRKIRSIRSEGEKKRIGLKADMDVADVELRELEGANEVDLDKVRKKLREKASSEAELRFSTIKMKEDIKGVLTDAQLDELRVFNKGSLRAGRPGGRGGPGGPGGHECGHGGR